MQLRYLLSVSDDAHEGLKKLGINHSYLNPSNTDGRGLSAFMCALLDANQTPDDWDDTRPGLTPEIKLALLEGGQLGEWDDGAPRIVRCLLFPQHYQELTTNLALALGVIRNHQGESIYKTFSWYRVTKPGALISEFWEAVGLSYLTPINPPRPPAHRGKFRRKPYELNF